MQIGDIFDHCNSECDAENYYFSRIFYESLLSLSRYNIILYYV